MSGTLMQTLSVALGMSLVFSLLSLMASSAVELVLSVMDLRPKMLVRSLTEILHGASEEEDFAAKLLNHPLNRGLRKFGKSERNPTYLSSLGFAGALLDLLAPAPSDKPHDKATLRAALQKKIKDAEFRGMMLSIVDEADGKLDAIKSSLAAWFDDVQEQVRGYYARRSRFYLIIVAVVMVLTLNLDSLRIGSALWFDPELRERAAAVAEQYQADGAADAPADAPADSPTNHDQDHANPPPKPVGMAAKPAGATLTPTPTPASTPKSADDAKEDRFKQALASFGETREKFLDLGLPIGWSRAEFTATRDWIAIVAAVLNKLLGLTLTVLAISLGAPFWFDILNKLANLRANAGAKPPTEGDRSAQRNSAAT